MNTRQYVAIMLARQYLQHCQAHALSVSHSTTHTWLSLFQLEDIDKVQPSTTSSQQRIISGIPD